MIIYFKIHNNRTPGGTHKILDYQENPVNHIIGDQTGIPGVTFHDLSFYTNTPVPGPTFVSGSFNGTLPNLVKLESIYEYWVDTEVYKKSNHSERKHYITPLDDVIFNILRNNNIDMILNDVL